MRLRIVGTCWVTGMGKVCYRMRKTALGVAARQGKAVGQRLYVYKCPFCTHYHLTHQAPSTFEGAA